MNNSSPRCSHTLQSGPGPALHSIFGSRDSRSIIDLIGLNTYPTRLNQKAEHDIGSEMSWSILDSTRAIESLQFAYEGQRRWPSSWKSRACSITGC